MKVVFFHRKPSPGNFSIESLFRQIREHLPFEIQWEVKELRFRSQGFFKRLYIGIEAFLNQGDVNHITGDINFIALFMNKRKTVLTVHDIGFMKHPNSSVRFLLLWFWIKLPVWRSAFITTVSEATKSELLKYANVKPHLIKVIPDPISEDFQYSPKEFNVTEPVILQVGTKHNKNVSRLIKALQGIKCKLDIVGEIDNRLKQELHELKLNYTLSKNLSHNEILDKYRNADIISFVSTYEGFGMPILEANAMGRVVVTSNVLSMPEVAGGAAHLVDPYDINSIREGLLRVIEDKDYREMLLKNGLVNKNRFNAQDIANEYTNVYKMIFTG